MNLIIIRHAESTANVNPNVYFSTPDSAIPLSPTGVGQAEGLAEILAKESVDAIWCSPYTRTRATLEPYLRTNKVDYRESVLLREQEWPDFRSVKEREILLFRRERSNNEFFFKDVGYESYAQVADRAEAFLARLTRSHSPDATVVIMSHEVTIRMLLMILDNKSYEESMVHINNCEIVKRKLDF